MLSFLRRHIMGKNGKERQNSTKNSQNFDRKRAKQGDSFGVTDTKPTSNKKGENTNPPFNKPELAASGTDRPSSTLLGPSVGNRKMGINVSLSSFWRTEPGLYNKGNTCFMNSAIQALLCCPPFAAYFKENSAIALGNGSPSMSCSFKFLVEQMVLSSHAVDPGDFFRTLCQIFPEFRSRQQQDSQDFTRLLLQRLDEELQYPSYDESSHQLRYKSIIHDIFAGKLRKTTSCQCPINNPQVHEDQILELPLSVYEDQEAKLNQKTSLEDAIHSFFVEKPLEGQHCRCGFETVKTEIIHLPEILVILLKWIHGGSCRRGHFSFPLENLSFEQYMTKVGRCGNTTTYDLVAVVEHGGTPRGGHYKAYGKRQDAWFCFNDDMVQQVGLRSVESSYPYILFYRKVLPIQEKQAPVYISKEWLFKQKTFVEPGPIDNAAVFCEHGNLRNEVVENPEHFLKKMSNAEFQEYFKRYGHRGGSPLSNVEHCINCLEEMQNKDLERSRFAELDAVFSKSPTNNQLALANRWYDNWVIYVNGQAEHPGRIDNSRICDLIEERGVFVAKYDPSGRMYKTISVEMWQFLHNKYGGGPEVHVNHLSGEPQKGYPAQQQGQWPDLWQADASSSARPELENPSLQWEMFKQMDKAEPGSKAGCSYVSKNWFGKWVDYTQNKGGYPGRICLPTNKDSDLFPLPEKAWNFLYSIYGDSTRQNTSEEQGTQMESMPHTERPTGVRTTMTCEDPFQEACVRIYEKFQQLAEERNDSEFFYYINEEWWKQFEAFSVGIDGIEKPGKIDNKFIARQVQEAASDDSKPIVDAMMITHKQWSLLSRKFGSEPQKPITIRIPSQEKDMDVDSEDQPYLSDKAGSLV